MYAVIVEIQLQVKERKRFVWPHYAASLRARLECPVGLLVVATDDAVARWAAKPVDTGGLYPYVPYVLGPSGVPEITSEVEARGHPELAVCPRWLTVWTPIRSARCASPWWLRQQA